MTERNDLPLGSLILIPGIIQPVGHVEQAARDQHPVVALYHGAEQLARLAQSRSQLR